MTAVCIAGMHRSGTSMVARMLNLCGLYLGEQDEILGANPHNLEGHWENIHFLHLNEEILARLGGGWDLPPDLKPGWQTSERVSALRSEAKPLLDRMAGRSPWGWKDPRNSLTLPFWGDLIPELKVIVCVRNPVEVAGSLDARGLSSTNFSMRLWQSYNAPLLGEVERGAALVTHYDAFFLDPYAELRRLVEFLGLPAGDHELDVATGTMNRRLRHNKVRREPKAGLDGFPEVAETYAWLCARAGETFDRVGKDDAAAQATENRIAATHLSAIVGETEVRPRPAQVSIAPAHGTKTTQQHAKAPVASIIIPNFNGSDDLAACLRSLEQLDFPAGDLEIIVVDNGSNDGSAAMLQTEFPRARVIQNQTNLGFAAAANQGAEASGAEHLAFLHNDMRVHPNWLSALMDEMKREPGVACVGSTVMNWDGSAVDFFGRRDDPLDLNVTERGEPASPPPDLEGPAYSMFACSGAMLIRRSAFQEAGGFDADYWMYHEDVDLGWRLWLKGHKTVLSRESLVFHRKAASSKRLPSDVVTRVTLANVLTTAFKNLDDQNLNSVFPLLLYALLERGGRLSPIRESLPMVFREFAASIDGVIPKRIKAQTGRLISDDALFGLVGNPFGVLLGRAGYQDVEETLREKSRPIRFDAADAESVRGAFAEWLNAAHLVHEDHLAWDRDSVVQWHESQRREQDKVLQSVETSLQSVETERLQLMTRLAGIENSRSWKLILELRRLRFLIAPPMSLRGRLLGTALRWARRGLGRAKAGAGNEADVALVRASDLFDRTWYLSAYPDVATSRMDPARHYLVSGAKEGRDPGPAFSTSAYLSAYSDVRDTGLNPLVHFLRSGQQEGRQSWPAADDAGLGGNSSGSPASFLYELEAEVPGTLVTGKGTFLYLTGWCFHPIREVRRVFIRLGGARHPVANRRLPRPDLLNRFPYPNSLNSGFWAMVPVPAVAESTEVDLMLEVELAGRRSVTVELGRLRLQAKSAIQEVSAETPAAGAPLVAICMATYNPQPELFAAQVDSLRRQTFTNWICIVNDDGSNLDSYEKALAILGEDKRFIVFRNDLRLGHYRNFERALERVPLAADFVAFCDQDDDWYPEKLAKSIAAFKSPQDQLAYGDMTIIAEDGRLLAPSFWTTRPNSYASLEVMLFANTVTGAACMFRRSLLDEVLPFPPEIGECFHDHWVAAAALTKGRINYIDEPLYGYRQHGSNVYGFEREMRPESLGTRLRNIARAWRKPSILRGQIAASLRSGDDSYSKYVLNLVLLAKTLQLRVAGADRVKKASLRSIASAETRGGGLLLQALKYLVTRRPSLGNEMIALEAYIDHRLLSAYYRLLPSRPANAGKEGAAGPTAAGASVKSLRPATGDATVAILNQIMAPVPLAVSDDEPERVNVFMATINFSYLFGGYIGMFNLARRIAASGRRVRIVLVESTSVNPEEWRRKMAAYPGLEDLFDMVEVSYHFDRSLQLRVNPRDSFLATSCWTAHIASQSVVAVGSPKIVFFAQEYEPIFHAASSIRALAHASYNLPQHTVYSTELLREYFRLHRIGIYAAGSQAGDANSLVIQNAIKKFDVAERDLRARVKKRFLFYARPEEHAARNLYELGVMGLTEAIRRGYFGDQEWELHGIGTAGNFRRIPLVGRSSLELLPKVSLEEYYRVLPTYDLGMSLMLSPHPSLVPLEMAAAGMVTVTNTHENKTADKLAAISTNLLAVEPTIAGIADGLGQAVRRMEDYAGRLAGTHLNWARTWEETFNPHFMTELLEFLRRD